MSKGYSLVYILIGILVILIGGVILFINRSPETSSSLQILSKGTSISSPWKTYTSQKNGFSLTYPAQGVIPQEAGYQEGECGNLIKEQEKLVILDNFYKIQILDWKGTIDDYLVSKGAKNQYDIEVVEGSGADEAIKIIGLKKGSEYAVGYPPLVYISYLYKKGNGLFIVSDLPKPENGAGCLNPKVLDPIKYSKYTSQGWDFAKNFKFL